MGVDRLALRGRIANKQLRFNNQHDSPQKLAIFDMNRSQMGSIEQNSLFRYQQLFGCSISINLNKIQILKI